MPTNYRKSSKYEYLLDNWHDYQSTDNLRYGARHMIQ